MFYIPSLFIGRPVGIPTTYPCSVGGRRCPCPLHRYHDHGSPSCGGGLNSRKLCSFHNFIKRKIELHLSVRERPLHCSVVVAVIAVVAVVDARQLAIERSIMYNRLIYSYMDT